MANEQARKMIREAEALKARIAATPGNHPNLLNYLPTDQQPSIVDNNYISVGVHIDLTICEKIGRGEFVDFTRLLPCERPAFSDEGRLELVQRAGQTFFVPAIDRDGSNSISNFHKWE